MKQHLLLALLLISSTFIARGSRFAHADEKDGRASDLPPASGATIDFVRDVQPIFQRSCVRCHGPEKQKSDYRLDVREIALTRGESYAPNIVPNKSADSPIIRFVAGIGDVVMPPEGERLTADEIGVLRAWIDQGARWPDEAAGKVQDKRDLWSLKPLVKPSVPVVAHSDGKPSAIDQFILAKLGEKKFSSSPEADRQTLIRRVYFDLIGLPPTPDEVDAFVADASDNAYENMVDRLLDSPRYGERWARHWLDAVHFAETHGHDQDRIRENAWPYRDYLVAALNSDTPYSQFVQEQVAGDVLFPEKPGVIAALGFLAAGPWDESSLRDIREDTIDRQVARYLDRDDMVATVMNNVTSLTVQCARCHDHKFDPITQRDYYSLQAVFSGVERANRRFDSDPEAHRQRMALLKRKSELVQRSPDAVAQLLSDDVQQQVAAWESESRTRTVQWHIVDPDTFSSSDGATLTKLPDHSILSGGERPEKDTVTIVTGRLVDLFGNGMQPSKDGKGLCDNDSQRENGTSILNPSCNARERPLTLALSPEYQGEGTRDSQRANGIPILNPLCDAREPAAPVTAIRLEVLADDSLPHRGPGRQDNGNLHLSEFEVFVDDRSKPELLVNPTADFNQQDWDITKSIDQNESTAWGIHPQEGLSHQAIFEFKEPLTIRAVGDESSNPSPVQGARRTAARLRIVLKQLHGRQHLIGRIRISFTDAATPVRVDAFPGSITAILAVAPAERTSAQKIELATFQQLELIDRKLSLLPKPTFVYAAAADFDPDGSLKPPPGPRPIHVLHRGDIRQPREEATPGTVACVTDLGNQFEIPAGAPESARRAALALWLTHKDNPLTWRSIVNRVWYHHFGRGLVGTLNDFGHMGESPSHPELLDWLAVEFRDHGQSLKSLHKMIVISQTYRQTVKTTAGTGDTSTEVTSNVDPRIAFDADNRLLWRMNRTRLDAESIRDAVLATSGRLDLRMGGPSDRQFDLQPGIHVTPKVDYSKFDLNSELGRRRSIYRFLFRTLPDPFMESLDCPSGDQMTPVRGNSVTVQQALALWNDSFIASHCEHLASRIQRDVAKTSPEQSDGGTTQSAENELAVRLILCRLPTRTETVAFRDYTKKHGLANLCRLLLNSNEFLFVE